MLDKTFSKSNAEFFSELSMNAYLPVEEFVDIYVDKYDIKFFDNGSTQGYSLWDEKDLIYVFRGTEPTKLSDIEADIKFWKTGSETVGKVHRGFKEALDLIWEELELHHDNNKLIPLHYGYKLLFSKQKLRNVFFTGHSLGAALATLAAARLGNELTQGYTYGSPRVGDKNFVMAFNPEFFRFRNNNDIVTRHPMELIGFKHIGLLNYFDNNGDHTYKFSRFFMFKQFVSGMFSGFFKLKIDSFSDHSSEKYNELCKKFNSN